MAKATNQSILKGTNGKMGDLLMRTVNGKTIISKKPHRRTKKSEREIANHNLFRQAAASAVEALRNPEVKLHFQNVAKIRKLPNAYTAALSLKLRELKTQLREPTQDESTNLIQECVYAAASIDNPNFTQICRDTENIIGDALLAWSTAWHNIERLPLDEKQKEVSRTIIRSQVKQWLEFV